MAQNSGQLVRDVINIDILGNYLKQGILVSAVQHVIRLEATPQGRTASNENAKALLLAYDGYIWKQNMDYKRLVQSLYRHLLSNETTPNVQRFLGEISNDANYTRVEDIQHISNATICLNAVLFKNRQNLLKGTVLDRFKKLSPEQTQYCTQNKINPKDVFQQKIDELLTTWSQKPILSVFMPVVNTQQNIIPSQGNVEAPSGIPPNPKRPLDLDFALETQTRKRLNVRPGGVQDLAQGNHLQTQSNWSRAAQERQDVVSIDSDDEDDVVVEDPRSHQKSSLDVYANLWRRNASKPAPVQGQPPQPAPQRTDDTATQARQRRPNRGMQKTDWNDQAMQCAANVLEMIFSLEFLFSMLKIIDYSVRVVPMYTSYVPFAMYEDSKLRRAGNRTPPYVANLKVVRAVYVRKISDNYQKLVERWRRIREMSPP